MTASALDLPLIQAWGLELQQLTQGAGSRLMQAGTQSAIDGLKVRTSVVTPLGENAAQQLIYFL